MKNKLRFIVPILVSSLLIFLLLSIKNKLKSKQTVEKNISTLAQKKYIDLDSLSRNIEEGKTTFLFFFNSGCHYCQDEIAILDKNEEKFKNANVYLISSESLSQIKSFTSTYLGEKTKFSVGKIDEREASEDYGVSTYPFTLVYGKNGELVQKYKGLVKLDALLEHID